MRKYVRCPARIQDRIRSLECNGKRISYATHTGTDMVPIGVATVAAGNGAATVRYASGEYHLLGLFRA